MSSTPGNQVEKWADSFMFRSETHNAAAGPQAHLLNGSNDPLGQIAACAKMYMGEVVRDLADVTDEERRFYLAEMQKTKLKMPLEAVSLHFMLENVTRAFTHQLVRQRTAAYAQESMRFAVVEDMTEAVALPPSLAGTISRAQWLRESCSVMGEILESQGAEDAYIERYATMEQKARFKWDETVATIGHNYMALVNNGMPAEDARGLMPTNIITRVNYITNLRGLLDHAGNRLCTQAQFEWRIVFAQIAEALRRYGLQTRYLTWVHREDREGDEVVRERTDEDGRMWRLVSRSSYWQYEALADLLKPVCYQTGKCAFGAEFDRKCSIRGRVNANADLNRPSTEWAEEYSSDKPYLMVDAYNDELDPAHVGRLQDGNQPVFIGAIHPREWLANPAAAR